MDEDLEFLRLKARQCREFARYHDGAAAAGLLDMADELEAKAADVERRLAILRQRLPPPRPQARH
jgi:hypothetical protein